MQVIKRDGRSEGVHFEKITARIRKLCYGLDPAVDPVVIASKVCADVVNGITSK